MGQAWCKEKTTRAQDSKSPFDRVFVRCAHRIYPGLKDEGSVLGGATQRVTSSEIGYAGSPPRHVLARGRSIDSVDRPFHPSDWVDVNLEAPSTPRTGSAFTNLTTDPAISSHSNLRDVAPIPPPRRKRRWNKDRPLPPKPDDAPGNLLAKLKRVDTNDEPFYTSVKPLAEIIATVQADKEDSLDGDRTRGNAKDPRNDDKRSKEIYEHKINGTGRIIPSDVVSGKRSSYRGTSVSRTAGSGNRKKNRQDEEYQKFARSRSVQDSSTPKSQFDARENQTPASSDESRERTKNVSTVSLPNYDELQVSRYSVYPVDKREKTKTTMKENRRVNSTGSINVESSPSPSSRAKRIFLEERRMRTNTDCGVEFLKYDPKKLEDWDLSDASNCDSNHRQRSCQSSPTSEIIGENVEVDSLGNSPASDVVDDKKTSKDINLTKSPIMQKPESFGKTSAGENSTTSTNVDRWITGQNSHLRYFDPPTLAMCDIAGNRDGRKSSAQEPFFLVEENHRANTEENIGESSTGFARSSRLFERRLSNESEPFADSYEKKELSALGSVALEKLVKTISDESLPREMLDSADENDDDFFAERSTRALRREMAKDRADSGIAKTPSPSPEPRIKPEIQENEHSCLLKVLKEEAANGSNLSSMTPSLTELEAALSDLLEKDGAENDATPEPPLVSNESLRRDDHAKSDESSSEVTKKSGESKLEKTVEEPLESPIEPSVKVPKKPSVDDSLETGAKGEDFQENLVDEDLAGGKSLAISSTNEESTAKTGIDPTGRSEFIRKPENVEAESFEIFGKRDIPDEPPEKPSRLYRMLSEEFMDTGAENFAPTPPRRKNRNQQVAFSQNEKVEENVQSPRVCNDRLI